MTHMVTLSNAKMKIINVKIKVNIRLGTHIRNFECRTWPYYCPNTLPAQCSIWSGKN